MFSNRQQVSTTPEQLQNDMRQAEKAAMSGDLLPLQALVAAHVGNTLVESWAAQVNHKRHGAEYRFWVLSIEGWH